MLGLATPSRLSTCWLNRAWAGRNLAASVCLAPFARAQQHLHSDFDVVGRFRNFGGSAHDQPLEPRVERPEQRQRPGAACIA
jgi:hypothetical protein